MCNQVPYQVTSFFSLVFRLYINLIHKYVCLCKSHYKTPCIFWVYIYLSLRHTKYINLSGIQLQFRILIQHLNRRIFFFIFFSRSFAYFKMSKIRNFAHVAIQRNMKKAYYKILAAKPVTQYHEI